MDHFQIIYANKAKEYHRMIAAEDVEGNLLKVLQQITPWENKSVLDLGSGTGRFPQLFQAANVRFICLDLYHTMLVENRKQQETSHAKWPLVQGDMRLLPFPRSSTDIVIAGWAIGHLRSWYSTDWKKQIAMILNEMLRVVRSPGTIIICETMSTGSLEPKPPVAELGEYYAWLENDWQMQPKVVQTDYQFASIQQAVEYTEFFFGADLAGEILKRGWARLPEWTGIWYKAC